jgi:hypothetical protein
MLQNGEKGGNGRGLYRIYKSDSGKSHARLEQQLVFLGFWDIIAKACQVAGTIYG